MDYNNIYHIHRNPRAYKISVNNLSLFLNQEVVSNVSLEFEGRSVKLRTQKKHFYLIMDLVGNFTKPGELVVDFFKVTFDSFGDWFKNA